MELNHQQAEERLNSPNNLANRLAEFRQRKKLALDVESHTLAVTPGRQLPRLPQAAKVEIADKIREGTHKVKDLAEEYGVTSPTITAIKKNVEKAEDQDRQLARQDSQLSLKEKYGEDSGKIEQAVKDEAVNKLMLALGLISQEKLEKLKAKDLASIGNSMAGIYKDMSPNKLQGALVNLVVYSPEVRPESSYKVIEISSDSSSLPDGDSDRGNRY